MDRVPGYLGYDGISPPDTDDGAGGSFAGLPVNTAFPLSGRDGDDELVKRADQRLRVPERLLALAELDCHFDAAERTLWTFMRPNGRPSSRNPPTSRA